jgi:hypothetical protein
MHPHPNPTDGTGVSPRRRDHLNKTILGFLLLPSLLCCAGANNPQEMDLRGVLDRFHHDLRWQFNDSASARVDPRFAAAFLDELEDFKEDLHITAWEIRSIDPTPGKKQAHVRIRLTYYKLPSTIVLSETIEQVWQQEEERWFLVSSSKGPFVFPPVQEKSEKTDEQHPEQSPVGL